MKNHPSVFRRALTAMTAALFLGVAPLWAATTYVWNNAGGGNWNVAGNWTPVGVPGAADTAQITAAGTYTVTVTDTESVASVTVGGNTGGPTLHVKSGGVLNDVNGAVAAISSMTVEGGGQFDVGGTFYLYGPLTNAGTLNMTNAGFIIYNNDGSPFLGGINNQGAIYFYGVSGDSLSAEQGDEYLINEGTINQQAGAGISSINVYGTAFAGTYNAAAGTTLQFGGGAAAANALTVPASSPPSASISRASPPVASAVELG